MILLFIVKLIKSRVKTKSFKTTAMMVTTSKFKKRLLPVIHFIWMSIVVNAQGSLEKYIETGLKNNLVLQEKNISLESALMLGQFPSAVFWYAVLRRTDQDVSFGESMRAYYVSQLGKYVPGKWMVILLRRTLLHSREVGANDRGGRQRFLRDAHDVGGRLSDGGD